VRKALFDGGAVAIAASTDPMIVYARSIDPALACDSQGGRGPRRRSVARGRRAHREGALRGIRHEHRSRRDLHAALSYGSVKGFVNASGVQVPPYTTIGGLFDRATGVAPYVLPPTWLNAKSSLDLATPMNLSTTNDIIGGNSGSPLINARGEIVGLIFDGNIYSLGGDFGYDGRLNRSVAVDSRALLAGLSTVYHADRLVSEIQNARTH